MLLICTSPSYLSSGYLETLRVDSEIALRESERQIFVVLFHRAENPQGVRELLRPAHALVSAIASEQVFE